MSENLSDSQDIVKKGWGIPGALFLGLSAYLLPNIVLVFFVPSVQALLLGSNIENFVFIVLFELLVIVTLFIFVKAYGLGLRDLGLNKFKPKHLGLVALGFVVYFAASRAISFMVQLLVGFDENQAQEIGFSNPVGLELLFVFVAVVVLAPLAEELLFRGFMFKGFRKRLPFWPSALLVSGIFALIHGQVNVGLDVFALSMVLCWLREKTGSLWPSIILHAAKNFIAFLLLFVLT